MGGINPDNLSARFLACKTITKTGVYANGNVRKREGIITQITYNVTTPYSVGCTSEDASSFADPLAVLNSTSHASRVAQGAYLEVEYIRNVLSVSGTLKYADSGTA